MEVMPTGTQKDAWSTTRRTMLRRWYLAGVLPSIHCSGPARPHQHVPGFFPCLLPAECAVRPALLFGAATRNNKIYLSAVVGRGLPGPAQHGWAGIFHQGKELPRPGPCFLRAVLPADPCPTPNNWGAGGKGHLFQIELMGFGAWGVLCFGNPSKVQG